MKFEILLKTKKVQQIDFLEEKMFYSRYFERQIWVQQNKKDPAALKDIFIFCTFVLLLIPNMNKNNNSRETDFRC